MSRVSRGVVTHSRHKRLLKLAKGYRGRRKSCIRIAKQATIRAASGAYVSRRLKRRFLKRELILCLNHNARCYSMSYKLVKFGLKKLGLYYSVNTVLGLLRSSLGYDALIQLLLFCSLS
ncbi:50S ribosomal protein L20 [Candidatus Hodgkinia cicadicola]